MKRVLMVLAVALMMAVMMVAMAAPAISKNIRPEPDGDGQPPYDETPLGEPPVTSGNFPTFVFHCNTELRGGEGSVVHNKNHVQGGGDC